MYQVSANGARDDNRSHSLPGRQALGLLGPGGKPVHAPDRVADDLHLALELPCLVGPVLGQQAMPGIPGLLIQFVRQRNALISDRRRFSSSARLMTSAV